MSLQDFRTKRLLPIESFQARRTKNVTPTEPPGVCFDQNLALKDVGTFGFVASILFFTLHTAQSKLCFYTWHSHLRLPSVFHAHYPAKLAFVPSYPWHSSVLNRNQAFTPPKWPHCLRKKGILNALSCRKRPDHVHISATVSVQIYGDRTPISTWLKVFLPVLKLADCLPS